MFAEVQRQGTLEDKYGLQHETKAVRDELCQQNAGA